VSKKLKHLGIDRDDREQAGNIGVLRAERKYDPARGGDLGMLKANFASFEMLNEARTWHSGPHQVSTDPEYFRSDSKLTYMSRHEQDTDNRLDLAELLPALTPRERQVIELRFGLAGSPPMSCGEAGKALGVSRQGIHYAEGQALRKLRIAHRRRREACSPPSARTARPSLPAADRSS